MIVGTNAFAQFGDMPEAFYFVFGREYKLVKQGDNFTIDRRKAWPDAQRPPQDRPLDDTSNSIRISAQAARQIWQMISAIDMSRYAHPGQDDFEPTPPDMRHTEQLNFVVDGKVIVNWSRGYKLLKPDLRAPLADIETAIRENYNGLSSK